MSPPLLSAPTMLIWYLGYGKARQFHEIDPYEMLRFCTKPPSEQHLSVWLVPGTDEPEPIFATSDATAKIESCSVSGSVTAD